MGVGVSRLGKFKERGDSLERNLKKWTKARHEETRAASNKR